LYAPKTNATTNIATIPPSTGSPGGGVGGGGSGAAKLKLLQNKTVNTSNILIGTLFIGVKVKKKSFHQNFLSHLFNNNRYMVTIR
jgi:hypothetical protein